jgi:hypothetical protein
MLGNARTLAHHGPGRHPTDDEASAAGKAALESLEMDVEEDADGQPTFIMMTKGAVTRTFPGGPAPRRLDEIALASPGGFVVASEARRTERRRANPQGDSNCPFECPRNIN